jgi:hypothetical protein
MLQSIVQQLTLVLVHHHVEFILAIFAASLFASALHSFGIYLARPVCKKMASSTLIRRWLTTITEKCPHHIETLVALDVVQEL